MRLPPAKDVELAADATVDRAFWKDLVAGNQGAVLVVWLAGDDMTSIGELAAIEPRPPMIFASSSMLSGAVLSLPVEVRGFTFLTKPDSFAEDEKRARVATTSWLRAKRLPVTNFEIQSKMYLLGGMLTGSVKMMRDDFYRDYFFDIVDMMRDQYYVIAVYPRLSFGPGQRYASKGCYIVQLTGGEEPKLEKRSNWVIH